jgi:Lrp/AsnC family transcriptional regulator, leucine-responsive regulatory protein
VASTVLDEIDRTILRALIRNGRASYRELGELARLSPHAVAPRVRRLLDAGVITGFTATIDDEAVGRGLDALIDVRLLSTATPEQFEQTAAELPAVREVSFLTGRFDYQLRVACRDTAELDRLLRHLKRDGGVSETDTRVVLRSAFARGAS